MFEYGFEENQDFSLLKIGKRSVHNKIDYALTLDCAKEISMLQYTAEIFKNKTEIQSGQLWLTAYSCKVIQRTAISQHTSEKSVL